MKTSEKLKMNSVGAGIVSARRKNGITLVALIITIIVMLILVAVSVQVVINSNLVGTAQDAGDRTEAKYQEEGNMSEITIENTTYESIDKYLNPEKTITFYVGGTPYTALEGWNWKTFIEKDTSNSFCITEGKIWLTLAPRRVALNGVQVTEDSIIIDGSYYDLVR